MITSRGKHMDVYSSIWAAGKGGKKNLVMAFRTWTRSRVGRTEDWYGDDWHAWGSAIIGDKWKKLIIFDCEPKDFGPEYTPRVRKIRLKKQRGWVEYARKKKASIDEIWYSKAVNRGRKGDCIAATME